MPTALINGRVLSGERFLENRSVLIEGGRILEIVAEDDPRLNGLEKHDLQGQLLLPGFLDTQVNGGGGVLFNDEPSIEAVDKIGRAHRRFGTT